MVELKKFFERGSTLGPITGSELVKFKTACTLEEWDGFVKAATAQNMASPA